MASENQERRSEDEPTEPIATPPANRWGAPQPWEDDRSASSRQRPGDRQAQRPPASPARPAGSTGQGQPADPLASQPWEDTPGEAQQPSAEDAPAASAERSWEQRAAADSGARARQDASAAPARRPWEQDAPAASAQRSWDEGAPATSGETAQADAAEDSGRRAWDKGAPEASGQRPGEENDPVGRYGVGAGGGEGQGRAVDDAEAMGGREAVAAPPGGDGAQARGRAESGGDLEPDGRPESGYGMAGEAEERELVGAAAGGGGDRGRKRISGAGVIIGVLLALLGFSLVVQVKSNSTDAAFASAREGDLLQIMSDLDGSETRLEQDIASLEAAKRELVSGAAGQEAAQAAAKARADDMGILAGTLPAQGPGVQVVLTELTGTIRAASLLNAVQELRGGGAEAILVDATGGSVRVIASTSFVDDNGGINVDGTRLTAPYTILAIGEPDTLSDAVQFAGGVVPRVKEDGGNVIVSKRDVVEIKEIRRAPDLEYARPAS